MKNVFNIFTQYRGLSKSAYVLFFARLVTSMGAFIWPMLTMILSIKMGYSESEIALIFLGISVVFLPATVLGGKLADKFDKKKIIIIFDLISVGFFFACAFLEPGLLMLIFFITAGLFATMEGPAHGAIVAEASLPKEREKVYSLNYLGNNLGLIFGATLGGLMFNNYLNLMFLLDGLTTLSSTVLIVLFVQLINQSEIAEEEKNEYEQKESDEATGVTVLSSRKSVMFQIFIFMISAIIYDQWTFVIPLKLSTVFGELNGPRLFGIIAASNGFIVILFTPILTFVLKKLFELQKILIGFFVYAVSFLILIEAEQLFLFFVFIFLFTLGEITGVLGVGPYLSRRVPSSHRGRIESYRHISYFVGGIIGKVATGFIVEYLGYNEVFTLFGVLGTIAAILTIFNYRLDRKIFPKLYIKKTKEAS